MNQKIIELAKDMNVNPKDIERLAQGLVSSMVQDDAVTAILSLEDSESKTDIVKAYLEHETRKQLKMATCAMITRRKAFEETIFNLLLTEK